MFLIVWYVVKGMNQVLRKNSRSFFRNNTSIIASHIERKGHCSLKKIMVTIKRMHTDYVSIYQYRSLRVRIYQTFLLSFIHLYIQLFSSWCKHYSFIIQAYGWRKDEVIGKVSEGDVGWSEAAGQGGVGTRSLAGMSSY